MRWQIIISILLAVLAINLVGAYTISPNNFEGYNVKLVDGQEGILFGFDGKGISIDKENEVCLTPQVDEGILTFGKGENTSEINIKYPDSINVRRGSLSSISNSIQKVNNQYCYQLDSSDSLFYKIGENSIIISGTNKYNSTDSNITQESGFAHLNISNNEIYNNSNDNYFTGASGGGRSYQSYYFPFDSDFLSTPSIAYDFSNNNKDGLHSNTQKVLGLYGNASYFNGVNSSINEQLFFWNNISGEATYNSTVSFWIKAPNQTGVFFSETGVFASPPSSFYGYFFIGCDGVSGKAKISSLYNSGDGFIPIFEVLTNANVCDDEWHYFAFTYNKPQPSYIYEGNGYLYVDGSVDKNFTFAQFGLKDSLTKVGYLNYFDPDAGYISSNYLNGTIDDLTIIYKKLNSSQINDIYLNRSDRFLPAGEQIFKNINLGTNTTLNITLQNCQTLFGSYLSAKINNLSEANFTNCKIENYTLSGTLNNSNLSILYHAGTNNFYSPIVIGNITLDPWVGITPCSPTGSSNWIINGTNCVVENTTLNTGAGFKTILIGGGNLIRINSNLTTDAVWIDVNSGSKFKWTSSKLFLN